MAEREAERDGGGSAVGGVLKVLLWAGAAVGLTALVNALIFYRTPPLRSPLGGGAVRYWPTPLGDIFYKTAGSGPPLLLVHSIGAGCSSYEFRRVWDELARDHTVYALDLLGFGKSDKPDIAYQSETYIALLAEFAREVMGVGEGGAQASVVASSLPAAYLVALARREPSLFHKLVLVCPTGMEELNAPPTPLAGVVRTLLKAPVLGTAVYNFIARRQGIRSFLTRRVYAEPTRADDETVSQFHTAAHQPGGERVLPFFLTGQLNCDIRNDFPALADGPLVVWGREAKQSPVTLAEAFARANPFARVEIVEGARMLPHEERPEEFLRTVRPFLSGVAGVV
jgi:pimeloyl-ACP methyl ester carboxylesterase